MSDQLTLAAETRDRVGKGASRALRREGRVPAVIYGQKQEPSAIHLEEKALIKALIDRPLHELGGDGRRRMRTLPKDVAFHPVTDRPIHVDFLRIGEHTTVTSRCRSCSPTRTTARASSRAACSTSSATSSSWSCDAAEIPSEITISLKGREVGDSIHISDVDAAQGRRSRRSTTATSRSRRSCRRPCRPSPTKASRTPRLRRLTKPSGEAVEATCRRTTRGENAAQA